MKNNKKKLKTNDKIKIFIMFLAFILLIFLIRLLNLQIFDVYNYKNKGKNISVVGEIVKPNRGNILDRNNKALAISQEVENLYLLRATSKEKYERAEKIKQNTQIYNELSREEKLGYENTLSLPVYNDDDILKLSNILEIDKENIYKLLDKEAEGYIYKSLSTNQKSQIDLLNLNYLRILKSNERYYPNNNLLSNTIGFLDNDDKAYYGLEAYYDELLSGKNGYKEFFKAMQGTEIPYTKSTKIDSVEASNIITTIDLDLQNILTEAVNNAFIKYLPMSINAVLMNPNNGEILAIESLPGFNLNNPRSLESEIDKLFLNKLDANKISSYLQSRWNNKLVSSQYDPGSVQKVITTAIAVESNISLTNKVYNDRGYIDLANNVRIYNWLKSPLGPMNIKEALIQSSNPVFVEIARDIGKKDFIEYAKPFRFGNKTQIDLPGEVSGFFPDSYKINDVDFGTLSYGHYLNVNTLQLVSAVNSVVNGGNFYKPHLLKEISDKNNQIIFKNEDNFLGKTVSDKTADIVRAYMKETGDNYSLNKSLGINVAAKTGTSVKYNKTTIFEETPDDETVITSIYTAFPAENPKYSLYISFDEPQKSKLSSGAPRETTVNIIKNILKFKQENISKLDNDNIVIPSIKGKTVEEAIILLNEKDLKLKLDEKVGKYHIVKNQYPEENNLITKNQAINAEIENYVKLPKIEGLNIEYAKKMLEINHIKYKIVGDGNTVIKQSIETGQIVIDDSEIILYTEE